MRPLGRLKAEGSRPEEYLELGIPEKWVPVLQKLGYTTIEKLKEVGKPGMLAKKNVLIPGVYQAVYFFS